MANKIKFTKPVDFNGQPIENFTGSFENTGINLDFKYSSNIPYAMTYPRLIKFKGLLYLFLNNYFTKSLDDGKTWDTPIKILPLSESYTFDDICNLVPFVNPSNSSQLIVFYRANDIENNYYSLRAAIFDDVNSYLTNETILLANNGTHGSSVIVTDSSILGLFDPFITQHTNGKYFLEYTKEVSSNSNICAREISFNSSGIKAFSATEYAYGGEVIPSGCKYGAVYQSKIINTTICLFHEETNGIKSIRYCVSPRNVMPASGTTSSKVLLEGYLDSNNKKINFFNPVSCILPDGRLIIGFLTNRDYKGFADEALEKNSHFEVWISKRKVLSTDLSKLDSTNFEKYFQKVNFTTYVENEYSAFCCLFYMDDKLFNIYNKGYILSQGTYDNRYLNIDIAVLTVDNNSIKVKRFI